MRTRMKVVGAAAAGVLIAGAAAGVSVATGDDRPLEGADLERATDAALAHTGGGRVVESELGDDGAAYEVEVRLDDGRVVEVQLDEAFRILGDDPDDDGLEPAGADD